MARLAAVWATREERRILVQGIPLSRKEIEIARAMGVAHPERVRLMKVDGIPLLNGRLVCLLATLFPRIPTQTVGISLRYGIYIHSDQWRDLQLIAHECVHTSQYERFGSIAAFMKAYFTECIEIGYPLGPLEQEAIRRAAIVGDR